MIWGTASIDFSSPQKSIDGITYVIFKYVAFEFRQARNYIFIIPPIQKSQNPEIHQYEHHEITIPKIRDDEIPNFWSYEIHKLKNTKIAKSQNPKSKKQRYLEIRKWRIPENYEITKSRISRIWKPRSIEVTKSRNP